MQVVELIDRDELVEMADVHPDNAYCLLNVHIRLELFDDGKYCGSIVAKEDGWTKESFYIDNLGKRAVNNRLKIFGLSL